MEKQQLIKRKLICGLCACNCVLQATLEVDGNIIGISGDKNSVTRGFVCLKGLAWREIIEQQSQLESPLQKQGENGWRKIRYDQALDLLAEQLYQIKARYGAQAFVFHSGQAGVRRQYPTLFKQFAKAYGSPNFSTIGVTCNVSRQIAYRQVLGGLPKCHYAKAKTIVLWGNNSPNTHPFDWEQIRYSCGLGAELLVITPRATEASQQAKQHLALKPGTDIYLAWAMLKIAVEQKCYNSQFVSTHVNDFVALQGVVSKLDLQVLCQLCGLPQEEVVKATKLVMQKGPTAIMVGSEVELQTYGNDSVRAIALLQGIAGTEALMFMPKPKYQPLPENLVEGKQIGAVEYPVFTNMTGNAQTNVLAKAIEQGEAKGLFVIGGNPLATWADSERNQSAFRRLDYLAVMDCRLTVTAELADLVLPAAGHGQKYELIEINVPDGRVFLNISEPIASTTNLNEIQLIYELAKRLGFPEVCPWKNSLDYFDYLLQPYQITSQQLLADINGYLLGRYRPDTSLPTASGKVEIKAPFLMKQGQQEIPLPPQPQELPAGTLFLNTCDKSKRLVHSRYRTVKKLAAGQKPQVKIAPATAINYGLVNNDCVELVRDSHKLVVEVEICETMAANSLAISHGWKWTNANVLTSINDLDAVTGYPNLSHIPVQLRKIQKVDGKIK